MLRARRYCRYSRPRKYTGALSLCWQYTDKPRNKTRDESVREIILGSILAVYRQYTGTGSILYWQYTGILAVYWQYTVLAVYCYNLQGTLGTHNSETDLAFVQLLELN